MKFGISTATFFSKLLTENSFEQIRKFGIDNCEIFLTTYCEYEPSFVETLVSRLQGINVHSVHALNTQFEPQLFNVAQRTRDDAEIIFDKVVSAAQTLGAEAYTFHGQSKLKRTAYAIDFVSLGNRVEYLAQKAAEKGVSLCFENVHWTFFDCPEFFTLLKSQAPSVKACLDIKQAMQSKIPYVDYLDTMADRLETVHLSDYTVDGNVTLPGKGIVDYDLFFSRLKDKGFDGNVILELYAKNYSSFDELGDSIEYVKNIISKY